MGQFVHQDGFGLKFGCFDLDNNLGAVVEPATQAPNTVSSYLIGHVSIGLAVG